MVIQFVIIASSNLFLHQNNVLLVRIQWPRRRTFFNFSLERLPFLHITKLKLPLIDLVKIRLWYIWICFHLKCIVLFVITITRIWCYVKRIKIIHYTIEKSMMSNMISKIITKLFISYNTWSIKFHIINIYISIIFIKEIFIIFS